MSAEPQHTSPNGHQPAGSLRGLAAYVERNPDRVEPRPRTGRPREREKLAQHERELERQREIQAQAQAQREHDRERELERERELKRQRNQAYEREREMQHEHEHAQHAHESEHEQVQVHKRERARTHDTHQKTVPAVHPVSPELPANVPACKNHTVRHKERHLRWEVLFGCGIVVVLIATLGTGGVIAALRSQAALNFQSSSVKDTASAWPESEMPDGNEGDVPGEHASDGQEISHARDDQDSVLAARDAAFAVDPNNTRWNFEQSPRKVVYLTIDDGPSANTQAILDILDRYQCKATFFVMGYNHDYVSWIAEAYKRGHTIGMHTFSHDYSWIYSSDEAFFQDLAQICDVVKQQIGYVPCFIRFPGGSSNEISANYNAGIMSRLAAEVQARGFQYYDWNRSFGDGATHTASELIGYACEPTDATNIVMLCHDSSAKHTTVEALPAIIEHYQNLGYTFEALNRESFVPHHAIAN